MVCSDRGNVRDCIVDGPRSEEIGVWLVHVMGWLREGRESLTRPKSRFSIVFQQGSEGK